MYALDGIEIVYTRMGAAAIGNDRIRRQRWRMGCSSSKRKLGYLMRPSLYSFCADFSQFSLSNVYFRALVCGFCILFMGYNQVQRHHVGMVTTCGPCRFCL